MTQACSNCMYYKGSTPGNPDAQGKCRLFPPVFLFTHTDFPRTAFANTEPN